MSHFDFVDSIWNFKIFRQLTHLFLLTYFGILQYAVNSGLYLAASDILIVSFCAIY